MSPIGATATSTPAKAQGKSAAPRRKRGEGQWALGYREPLNKNEENKKFDDGLNVRQRIIDIYAKQGFDSIDPADLRGRFRWYGLYTQRRPGIDGGKTAILEPEELDDRYFMLRVRIDGGQLSAAQLRVISDISVKYARGTADVTDRQNIQLHWIEIESVPAIWEALEGVGLSTTEACGDTPRVIMGCPLAGLDSDELIDATPEIAAIAEAYIGDPELSNLPRKFKSSISGCAAQCTHHEINDVAFAAVRHPETGEIGYDLWVGGGLSTNPMIAKRLGAFVRAGQVPEVWKAVCEVFRDYGYRRLRHRARIKFLIADWGAEKFREILEKEYLGYALPDGPAPVNVDSFMRDHVGVHRQRDGLSYVGFAPRVGRLNGELLASIAALAERYGSGRVRTTAEQKMVILDVPDASVPEPGRRAGRAGAAGGAERLPAAHDGVHRDRVLQARDRGDQGPGHDPDRRARAAAARLRVAGHDQRQRLPELLRPHPGRRHRPQGIAGDRRLRQSGGGVPDPPRRHADRRGRDRVGLRP
jgi:sulfite reductase (ferredoxin)